MSLIRRLAGPRKGTPESLDQRLAEGLADGTITAGDADQIRTFASFLSAAGPPQGHPDHDPAAVGNAYREHYPEEYEATMRDLAARDAATGLTGTEQ